ncbi:TetR/AcrR family transcriptional regulator [Alkaliphilus crotonatoxidans]
MDKKELQRQRMMGYFLDAAKEIIRQEGVKNLTVRKVGESAGYSYATIYNYFNDLNTLLLYCVFDFLEDCYRHVISFKDDKMDEKEQIIVYSKEYFKYFAQHPDMFQLIFVDDLGETSKEKMKDIVKPSVVALLKETMVKCAEKGYIKPDTIELLVGLIASSIHGKLLFYLRGRNVEQLDDMIQSLEMEITFLIHQGR